ncbi:hypothetical protein [Methylocystis sp.]|uniref:hypothetical protein n=1 Tax=Methylocystis sp. TaxID=1911079 RepID=UPI003DA502E1
MNFDEYERYYIDLYENFAATIRFILGKALEAAPSMPQPQAVQSRAKTPGRLKARLEEAGKLDTQTLEQDRKDLAGARIIFYTNNDVEKFLGSRIVFENFEVELDATKVHTPTNENERARYRAIHYVVRLTDERLKLPEYTKFAGLRCEIQIQTILNHAWSETSHDILYKDEQRDSFGTLAKKAIQKRFEKIMDQYLLPAGYEIQKAQQEYECLRQGRELFDRDVVRLLAEAKENNTRYVLLSGLRDYAIPNYDDIHAAYEAMRGPLVEVAKASRLTERVAIRTGSGELPGQTSADVTRVVVEIIDNLRYADAVGSLKALGNLYQGEENEDIRKQILDVTRRLSQYNIAAWNQVGPTLQAALLDYLASLSPDEISTIRPIAVTVYQQALEADVTGTEWSADSVVLQTGALPVSDLLKQVRARAIGALFELFAAPTDDDGQRTVLDALEAATRLPSHANYSNELLELTLGDTTQIVGFLTAKAGTMSYEVLQHEEHRLLWNYRRAKEIVDAEDDRFNCKEAATALAKSIEEFRDAINTDERYVRYKVLVGFDSVYPGHWEDSDYDYEKAEAYRKEQCEIFVDEVTTENENYWFDVLERCSATKSNDMATFPVFGQFIVSLAKKKPELADRFLAKASADLLNFLPGFLNGLAESDNKEIYERYLEQELAAGEHLPSLARHLRSAPAMPDFAAKVLAKAIDAKENEAVIECLVLCVEQVGNGKIADERTFFRSAMAYLTNQSDARWVRAVWFLPKANAFFNSLDKDDVDLLLENFQHLPKIEYQSERILSRLAERHLEAVWDYFGNRITRESMDNVEERFDAVPFRFHGLEKHLSTDPALAIAKGRAWYARDNRLFRYRAGRLLSNAFPNCTPEFAKALAALVDNEDEVAADFALEVLQNYEGQPTTHIPLKRIVAHHASDARKMTCVKISLDNTGLVEGEYGFADALQKKKKLMDSWLADEDRTIHEFAKQHIRELELDIATEHRRADDGIALRRLDFPDNEEQESGEGNEAEGKAPQNGED